MLVDMKPDAKFKPKAPQGSRLYAIGDIHGRLDLLDLLLEQIEREGKAAPAKTRLVLLLLGDLIDRGPDSRGVLERVAQLMKGKSLPGFAVHVLKGNHEDAMLRFLANVEGGEAWLANGWRETVESYGVNPDLGPESLRAALLQALPKAHRRVLRALELSHVEGDYAFVHAGVRPGVAWDAQTPDDLLWIRRDFTQSDADFGYFVVHGHSAADAPDVRANRVCIDTRAWASGVLTCLAVEGKTRRFLST